MKITVCFKIVPDYTRFTGQDCKIDKNNFANISYIKKTFNCFDESALEMALSLSDQQKRYHKPYQLTALTVDDSKADLFLRHLSAVQYDKVVRIDTHTEPDLRFDALTVSDLIFNYVKKTEQELIILGPHGGIGDNRQTGFLLAERLGWPCIRNVTNASMEESSSLLKVTSKVEGGRLIQKLALPALLIIGNTLDFSYLRVPTLKQKLNAKHKKIDLLSFANLGIDETSLPGKDKTLTALGMEKSQKKCVFIKGNNPFQKARTLYESHLKQRLTQ